MIVEYLKAHEDGFWDTVHVDVPEDIGKENDDLVEWAQKHLAGQAQYRRIVVWAVYCIPEAEALAFDEGAEGEHAARELGELDDEVTG